MTAAGMPDEEESPAVTGEAEAVAGEAVTGEAGSGDTAPEAGDAPGRDVIDLLEPADGLPPVITSAEDLAAAVTRLAAGDGPVAVDAERASGYRYGQRAYLVQLRRAGAGTVLIDPIACPDLSALSAAIGDVEAVLHAASQDLPCLAEIGYQPRKLFDTELAGRLLGYPRVALGTMLEEVLGFRLAKEHSAADWSVRPLPAEMLKYAALDVEVLTELRDALAGQLDEQGKTEWARQEFAAIAAAPPPPPRADPWRRTSGIHKVRTRRALAVVRELWQTRDEIARDADQSPRRVLSDQAIIDAARAEAAKPPPTGGRRLSGSAGSTRATPASTRSAGWPPCSGPASSTTPSSLRSPAPRRCPGRRPRTAGRSATRRRRRGSRPPGRPSARSPPRTGCPSRTCSRRTRCAAWPGSRRPRRPPRRSPRR